MSRSSGILLHPTCFPSAFGIGDLGKSAYKFIDFLASSHQKLWQVLPLGPTGFGNSPYMCYSAIAGNPLLIDLEPFLEMGLLQAQECQAQFPSDIVDFERVIPYKMGLLKIVFERFNQECDRFYDLAQRFQQFCTAEQDWLEDYALFMALLDQHQGSAWNSWAPELARRKPEAIATAKQSLKHQIQFHQFLQFQFFQQWQELRAYANRNQIQIIGDIPIYVAHNSADVWLNPQNFKLDPETFAPAQMAGVPPDYFSTTGQLWGNPVYDWEYLAETGFAWWVKRFKSMERLVDLIRIDHFRGFESYYQVAAGHTDARLGTWQPAPGAALFEKIAQELGSLPILAEDLGVITPEVEQLRDRFNFPGMRVLLFAFGGDHSNIHLPHHYVKNSCVYTGTHDNDTAVGWWLKANPSERELLLNYFDLTSGTVHAENIHWRLIRAAIASVADLAIFPLQDVLGLDNSARMNRPGLTISNWNWRYGDSDILTPDLSDRLKQLCQTYGR
ncbi:MAG: 4-alpha-glucanotransferase [Pseudanabaenaceae cyanobacterium bins.68]|nr:4-alpha-glucanotransferase [Pseudanabaenaceae cyanobacterium bins.68]